MKIYQDRVEPARIVRRLVRRECDVCGEASESADWRMGRYEVGETKVEVGISASVGDRCGDGGVATSYEVDVCPKCFVNKFIPWVNSQRVGKPPIEGVEIDW